MATYSKYNLSERNERKRAERLKLGVRLFLFPFVVIATGIAIKLIFSL